MIYKPMGLKRRPTYEKKMGERLKDFYVTVTSLRVKFLQAEEEEEDENEDDNDNTCKTSLEHKWSNQLTMKNKIPIKNYIKVFYSLVRLHIFLYVFFRLN